MWSSPYSPPPPHFRVPSFPSSAGWPVLTVDPLFAPLLSHNSTAPFLQAQRRVHAFHGLSSADPPSFYFSPLTIQALPSGSFPFFHPDSPSFPLVFSCHDACPLYKDVPPFLESRPGSRAFLPESAVLCELISPFSSISHDLDSLSASFLVFFL